MNKIVILDAGHNELTSGKQSPDGSYKEYEFNNYIRERMKYHLNRHGIKTIYVDSDKKNSSQELSELVSLANKTKGDIYVSLHSNAYGTTWSSPRGWEIFCYNIKDKTSNGYKLASYIHDESIPALGLTDRGIRDGSHLYVIKNTKMPAVVIEHAFHTNQQDLKLLKDSSFREKIAICNTKGILKFYGVQWKEEEKSKTKMYTVQLGAFSSKSGAEKLFRELTKLGYKPFIKEY